ncbi:MAG: RiPP maturation radical SAM C-methyltransferase [Acidobacteriota bacterium]
MMVLKRVLVDDADVILVCMPWATVQQPSIQLGLLTAQLRTARISVKSFYPNLKLSEDIGLDQYEKYGQYDTIFGKWVFSETVFGSFNPPSPESIDFFTFARRRGVSDRQLQELTQVKQLVWNLLEWCVASVNWQKTKIVGFTTTLLQTMPALALAKTLKTCFPHLKIIFGGASCQAVMGRALHRNFPFIDGVVDGEGEPIIVSLIKQLLDGQDNIKLPGLHWRSQTGEVFYGGAPRLANMQEYISPEYEDYFLQKSRRPSSDQIKVRLPFEASRGCWWATVKQCKFCGLNGETLAQRSRPIEAVINELLHQRARYNVNFFFAMDNILDKDHVDTLPHALREELPDCEFFFEIRVTMQRNQMKALADAGIVHVQPGIESMISEVLHLVDKGTNAVINLCFLRRCVEFGITPYWNLLHGFPGEDRQWYDRLIAELPQFFHLPCPDVIRFGLHRFSPFFDEPERYGIKVKGCLDGSLYIWNLPEDEIRDLSFELDFVMPEYRDLDTLTDNLQKAIYTWRNSKANLRAELTIAGQVAIRDSRPTFSDIYLLPKRASHVLRVLEQPSNLNSILARLAERSFNGEAITAQEVLQDLNLLIEKGLVYYERNKYLALTIPTQESFWLLDIRAKKIVLPVLQELPINAMGEKPSAQS